MYPPTKLFSLLRHFKTLSDASTPAASLPLSSPRVRLQFPPSSSLRPSLLFGSVCRRINFETFYSFSQLPQIDSLLTLQLSPGQLSEVCVFVCLCLTLCYHLPHWKGPDQDSLCVLRRSLGLRSFGGST